MSDNAASTAFDSRLNDYRKQIEGDINNYCTQVNQRALETYGENSQIVALAFTDLLKRGGKRIRGALTLVGYEMCGGKDQMMIIQAARAIEMMHTYMLIIDDIQDRSDQRRGGPSVHRLLESAHNERRWQGDAPHTGLSLALNAALLGSHQANLILSTLEAPDDLRIKALTIMNHTMVVTTHGQTNDIVNEVASDISDQSIENVMQWKTAHYSFLNPIHMGMVLAGAPCEDTNAITDYALNVGKAFQISDDLLVMNSKSDGKDAIDDIREGKQTVLTHYTLQNAAQKDVLFLKNCLGKRDLNEADFKRCQTILRQSGAAEHARQAAQKYIETARGSLQQHAKRWDQASVDFLDRLAIHILKTASSD